MQPELGGVTATGVVTPPASAITAPANGATLQATAPVTITGTAGDAGVVAGVDVSVDGGATWHPASGTTSWSYSWTPVDTGSVTIKARAHDDLGNVQNPGGGPAPNIVTVTVTPPPTVVCPCSLFPDSLTPAQTNQNDGMAIELDVRFRAT